MIIYQICTRCIMDTTDPSITFDEKGECNHCKTYDKYAPTRVLSEVEKGKQLANTLTKIKQAKGNNPYDCIIGLSGGVDSSYLAWLVKKWGLNPLAIHLDNGWNSELAIKNIENIVKKLKIDLITEVLDWEEFKNLQIAYLKASVVDIEVLTDNAIIIAIDRLAKKYKIKYFLSGYNFATESVMPENWYYGIKHDSLNIKSINKEFGNNVKLKTFPLFNTFQYFKYTYLPTIKTIPILDFVDYDKSKALEILKNELNWRDYGGKHWESKFTQFYQTYILPNKFNIDKRRAHYSSLILSGQITREEALLKISEGYDHEKIQEAKEFVLKKLNLSEKEFDLIMNSPIKNHSYYPSFVKIQTQLGKIKRKIGFN